MTDNNEDYRRRSDPHRTYINNVFYRLGYDINDPDDMRRLEKDFRWVAERREASEKRWAFRSRAVLTIIAAVAGPPITVVIQWIVNRYNGGGH